MTIKIKVSEHFQTVHGLEREYSEWSAERLREDVIAPIIRLDLAPNERLVIVIDKKDSDEYNYSHSYLREAFAGLITYGHISYRDFIHNVAFEYENESSAFYVKKIFEIVEHQQKEDSTC